MSLYDEEVQDFLKQNVKFLQKVKLPLKLKNDREELLRIFTEWISISEVQNEPDLTQFPEEPEDTYDDEGGGIYGEIGDDEGDDDMAARISIRGQGAKILNLHASFQGWLREEGFFKSSRWWCLVYSKGGKTKIVFFKITLLKAYNIQYSSKFS